MDEIEIQRIRLEGGEMKKLEPIAGIIRLS